MGTPLNRLTLRGFKSIRALENFEFANLNVLVGPNGAGKSNLVDFFRMLRAMAEEGLQGFVLSSGRADGFFFGGPKETPEIFVHMAFGMNEYRFVLKPTANRELMIASEETLYTGQGTWNHHGGPRLESRIKSWQNERSISGQWPSAESYVYKAISNWTIYHFHDTSILAPMRREQSLHDWRGLRSDVSNIAAFLNHLHEADPERYQRIRETIQLVAPFFDDFLLEPYHKGNDELIRLEWRQKGSSFPFQPWQLSDGTLRFICLATALLQPKPPFTIVIDEPELGLHPFALELLAGLLHEVADQVQLIVSTQSASLLTYFEPEHVIVTERIDGATQFRRLEAEPLQEWLREYSLGELWEKNVVGGGPSYE